MLHVAFIENRQLMVQEAQDRLEERRCQEQLTQDRDKLDTSMVDLDNRIKFLSSSHPDIVSSIDHLKKSRAELMKEQKLADLPGTIVAMHE
jgi:hypothetical protein